jgi:hypothetical protein
MPVARVFHTEVRINALLPWGHLPQGCKGAEDAWSVVVAAPCKGYS